MGLIGGIRKAADYFSTITDNSTLKKKLFLLYLLCVIVPVTMLDGALFANLLNKETRRQENEMANIAQAAEYSITQAIDDAVFITKDYWLNERINDFLNTEYASPYLYFSSFDDLKSNSIFDVSLVGRNAYLKLYADNDSIVNGSEFGSLSSVRDQDWYRYFESSGTGLAVYPYVSGKQSDGTVGSPIRCISVIRRLDHYSGCDKVMKLNIDYSVVENVILNANYAYPVYVCSGDTILYANRGNTSSGGNFATLRESEKRQIGYTQPVSFYTQDWNIYVLRQDSGMLLMLRNNVGFVATILAFSVLVPILFMYLFNRSFTLRLSELSRHLGGVGENSGRLEEIGSIRGKDEIGDLMRDYNRMASRINELIQVVYKRKLEEQAADIARQRAEVLALQSQINPHFLFNALESIRMHSVLKHEDETAEMICKLSVMMRQSVDWGHDVVTVAEEAGFAEAYLQLQKYRFGEQLSYRISVAPDCGELFVPKLTIVTFVENACIHGIEGKSSPGWIFIEAARKGDEMTLEIEDTGVGMPEDQLSALRESMENASIERLKSGGRVGIVNACVRLRTFCGGRVRFEVESEEGVGSTVTIHIPLSCARDGFYADPCADENGTGTEKKGENELC